MCQEMHKGCQMSLSSVLCLPWLKEAMQNLRPQNHLLEVAKQWSVPTIIQDVNLWLSATWANLWTVHCTETVVFSQLCRIWWHKRLQINYICNRVMKWLPPVGKVLDDISRPSSFSLMLLSSVSPCSNSATN